MWRYLGLVLVGAVAFLLLMWALRQVLGPGPVALVWLGILIAGVVVIVRNLTSNRKVADATPEARAQALTFAPEPAHAALYLLRTQFLGKAVGVNVEIDGAPVAQLKSPRFTRVVLTPGAHAIDAYTGPASGRKPAVGDTTLTAAPGDVIVLVCEVEPGMIGTVIRFKRVDLASVRDKLAKTRMVQPDLASL